ncbi:hypothetical protein PPERSA_00083 [Pseudocohnilembus persalinus]|uniref:L-2-hydroxyglutarate dehydrogenase, mitochondrial n=1 Tax=Pseudocohnilembus persalinus TaxID=266149 RepID=A0A0V0QZ56_PSEPJ|nr:hypothetical protein PPERSA_00083 [Pseudocohnilembus persalinus]|eukprot:KRX07173.1 hypothetical protein PPERSA_00083 [Pseudocohnilembus persalinus]
MQNSEIFKDFYNQYDQRLQEVLGQVLKYKLRRLNDQPQELNFQQFKKQQDDQIQEFQQYFEDNLTAQANQNSKQIQISVSNTQNKIYWILKSMHFFAFQEIKIGPYRVDIVIHPDLVIEYNGFDHYITVISEKNIQNFISEKNNLFNNDMLLYKVPSQSQFYDYKFNDKQQQKQNGRKNGNNNTNSNKSLENLYEKYLGKNYQLQKRDVFKEKLLKKMGFQVLKIPYYEWDQLEKLDIQRKMNKCADITIIGGGIIGSCIARKLSQVAKNKKILLLEKESHLGQHASTRNSSVIHAGIYYSSDSFKSKFCKKGNEMLTQYIEDNKLPLTKTGKYIVATNENEYQRLIEVKNQAVKNTIDVEWIPIQQAVNKVFNQLCRALC